MITPVSDLAQTADRLGWYHLLMVEGFWRLLTLRFTETRLRDGFVRKANELLAGRCRVISNERQ